MTYKLIEKKKSIVSVKSLDGSILYCTQSHELFLDSLIIASDVECQSYTKYLSLVSYQDNKGEMQIYHTQTQQRTGLGRFGISIQTYDGETAIASYDLTRNTTGNWKWKLGVFNMKTFSVEKQLIENATIVDFNESNYFGFKESKMVSFSKSVGKEHWSYNAGDLPTYAYQGAEKQEEVQRIIGLTGNLLWFSTHGNRLVALDAKTGELKHFLDWHKEEESFFVPRSAEAQLYINRLYILSAYLVVIDALTGEILYKVKTSDAIPKARQLTIASTQLQGNHISFSARKEGSSIVKHVGLFNILTNELEWLYEMPFDEQTFLPAGQVPQLAGNKLFILDSNHTLHVFERQDGQL